MFRWFVSKWQAFGEWILCAELEGLQKDIVEHRQAIERVAEKALLMVDENIRLTAENARLRRVVEAYQQMKADLQHRMDETND